MIQIMEEVFSDIEDSMRNMEDNMKDMGSMFRSPSTSGFGSIIIEVDEDGRGQRLPALPTPPKDKADANLRSLVLKDDDMGRTKKPGHNVPVMKKDENLDELVGSSSFSFDSLPRPPVVDDSSACDCDKWGNSQVAPKNQWSKIPGGGGWGSWSSSESSTYSFINGKWEGKSVRETNEGKETTTYTRDEKGELVTTTEFTPYSESSMDNPSSMNPYFHENQFPTPGIFGLFDRFFKPRL